MDLFHALRFTKALCTLGITLLLLYVLMHENYSNLYYLLVPQGLDASVPR